MLEIDGLLQKQRLKEQEERKSERKSERQSALELTGPKKNPFFKKRKTKEEEESFQGLRQQVSGLDFNQVVSPPRPMQLDFEAQRPNIISNIEMIQEQCEEAAATVQPQFEDDLPVLIQSPVFSKHTVSLVSSRLSNLKPFIQF